MYVSFFSKLVIVTSQRLKSQFSVSNDEQWRIPINNRRDNTREKQIRDMSDDRSGDK